ncbi:hypothetical protein GGR51DRAFT_533798 [Nemania sp. FL0031]|nr:hypothetical protein GGR51DRAFT_533798 [Nemania sp. FL0031]
MIDRRVFKAHHSQTKLSKSLQHQLLDVLARTDVESQSNSARQAPAMEDLNYNTPAASSKRPFDATSAIDSVPAKRCCSTQTSARSPIVEGEAEQQDGQGAYTSLQQPTPKRPKHSYALFLEKFVDVSDPVVAWLESSGDIRCRSDSHLYHRSLGSPIPWSPTISVPETGRKRDVAGFALPPTPPLIESPSVECGTQSNFTWDTSTSTRSSEKSLVEHPLYRSLHLATNNIYLRPLAAKLPDHITALVDDMGNGRDSPEPTLDEVLRDPDFIDLELEGAGESAVESYFVSRMFPRPSGSEPLRQSNRQQIAERTVPCTNSQYRVSTPVPDILYGYKPSIEFPRRQSLLPPNEGRANDAGLLYPFLLIELKGDGPSGCGSLWVATNQCLGGSVSCVNIAEGLNERLESLHGNNARSINSAIFSVAMNGTEARLYVSWKHDKPDFYMRAVDSFSLASPKGYLLFRRYIRNIIDWGKDKRLREIQESVDSLMEGQRDKSPSVVKSGTPSLSSVSGNTKRHKS